MTFVPIIYADILLAVNWVIDFLLLSVTAHVLRLTPKRWRLVLGALLGSVCACAIFLVQLPTVVVVVFHFLCACILIKISFPFSNLSAFLKQTLVLYVMSALFSGIVSVLWALTKSETFYSSNGVVYFDISPLMLTCLAVISYGIIRLYEYLTRRKAPQGYEFELLMDDGFGVCSCRALYDTGLHLREPFSGKPTVIVEYAAIQPYLAEELKETLCYSTISGTNKHSARVRLIPYRAIGGEGLLPAFIPKHLRIKGYDRKEWNISGTYVAVSKQLERGEYQALIGSDSIERGNDT